MDVSRAVPDTVNEFAYFRFGTDNEVSKGIVLRLKLPGALTSSDGRLILPRAPTLLGVKLPAIETSAGRERVCNDDMLVIVKPPAHDARPSIWKVVTADNVVATILSMYRTVFGNTIDPK